MKRLHQEDGLLLRNSSTGNASQKALVAGGNDRFSNEDRFIREVLQNSTDASIDPTQDVFVSFNVKKLTAEEQKVWQEEIGLKKHLEPRIKKAVPNFPGINEECHVLFINDYSTTGLTSDHTNYESESRFYRFFFGAGDNEDQSGSGGSFGYGKAVYTDNSRARTIVAYTCCIDNGKPTKKIFGITRTKKYEFEGKMHPGYIYHGQLTGNTEGEQSQPIEGDMADQLAEELGFQIRSDEETGTSIAVFGLEQEPTEFLKKIKLSTELFWWKKICDNQLSVEFIDTNGEMQNASPKSNNLLAPYLRCYEIMNGRKEKPSTEDLKYTESQLNKTHSLSFPPGKIAFLEIEAGSQYTPDADSLLINCVALFRSSGMVIEYRKPAGLSDTGKYLAGIFRADDKLNELLRSSEPASHWGWNETSARIAELEAYKKVNLDIDKAKKLIKSIKDRIDKRFNDFRDSLVETAKVSQASFRNIDRLMTELLGSGKNPGGGGGASTRNISIQNISSEEISSPDSLLEQYECKIVVSLDADSVDENKELVVKHYLSIKGDDAANTIIDRLSSKLVDTTAIATSQGKDRYLISKEPCTFTFRTEPVSPRFHRETETVVKGVS